MICKNRYQRNNKQSILVTRSKALVKIGLLYKSQEVKAFKGILKVDRPPDLPTRPQQLPFVTLIG